MQETSSRDKLTEDLPLEHARRKKLNQSQQKQKYFSLNFYCINNKRMKEMLTPTPMRRQSDLRMGSSLLPSSKKISKK